MKNKKYLRHAAIIIMTIVVALSCMGCTTSASTNAKIYFSKSSKILHLMFSNKNINSNLSKEKVRDAKKLPTVTNFTLDAQGNYSFDSVKNADHYLIYLCDAKATSDNADFKYCSTSIIDNGSKTYKGNLRDIIKYAYGTYLAKVYAFPRIADMKLTSSSAATATYSKMGNLSAPKIAYYWNTFKGTMNVQVANLNTYEFETYPNDVKVTFTNVKNPKDTIAVNISDVSAKRYQISTSKLKRGESYNIKALAKSSSKFLNKKESEVTAVGSNVALKNYSMEKGNYKYADYGVNTSSFDWPLNCINFNLAKGGNMGKMPKLWGEELISLEATPTAAKSGSEYSYNIKVKTVWTVPGTMELRKGGALIVNEAGTGPIAPTTIRGSWVDNGDGTVNISYDHSTIADK